MLDPLLIFPCLLTNLGPDKEIQVPVYAGDKFGGIWPGPSNRLGTGGSLYPSAKHQFDLFGLSKGSVDRPNGSVLNW